LAVLIALVLVLAFLHPRAGPGGGPAPAAGPPVAPQAEQEKLQGSWQVLAVQMGGQKWPHERMRFDFAADKMTMLFGAGRLTPPMPYVLDPSQEPKAIDVNSPGGVWRGIYELKGDSLTLCLNENPAGGGNRPATFQAQPGAQGVYLYVLRRE
jgi:uncharacterized protein (TIGR03067 family)